MIKLLVIFFIGYASAMTDEEVKAEFIKFIMKCTKTHAVEMSELMKLQKMLVPTEKDTKCLLACAYRMAGSMNGKGLYDLQKNYEIAETTQAGDEKRLANAKKLADICEKVNEVNVSDGEKGCERAALIFKCIVENAPKFGFKV